MRCLFFMTLASLLYSLVSTAPQQPFELEDTDSENTIPIEGTNSIIAVSTTEGKNESEEIVTEKQESEAITLKTNVSTHQTPQTEKAKTSSKEGQPPEKRDAETIASAESASTPQQQSPDTPTLSVQQETASEKPLESVTTTATPITTKRPKPSKPKPPRATTLKPLAVEGPTVITTTLRPQTSATVKPTKPSSTQRYPCRCGDGVCSCCTGIVLENFNVPLRSRACANVTYEPEEFAFNFKLAYNNIVLYNRRMSAKNPRPACIPINRYFGIKMCAKLSNVYMSGRNMHACLDFEGFFSDETAFKYSFNCFRIGTEGVAIVRPEDGGGLPPPPDEEEQTDEDYDDSARHGDGSYYHHYGPYYDYDEDRVIKRLQAIPF